MEQADFNCIAGLNQVFFSGLLQPAV